MSIQVEKGESIDNALNRFKQECRKNGMYHDARKHEHYDKPSVKKKKKAQAARQRKRH